MKILLLGNKADLEGQRVVSSKQGEELSRQYKCIHYEVSAKTGSNVATALINLVKMMLASVTEPHNDGTPTSDVIKLHNSSEKVEKIKCCR